MAGKMRAGDAAVMVQRVFPGTVIVQWGRRTYLAPPPAPPESPLTPTTRRTVDPKEVDHDHGRLFAT
jgi:hypothetical protein